MGLTSTGLLALSVLTSGGAPPEPPPMLFHRVQPAATARGEPSFQVMRRMATYLNANYPEAPPPRIFASRFDDDPVFHWFEPFESFDARVALDQARLGDEGWRALEDQAFGDLGEGASRDYLFHLGGAPHGGARMAYRWVRTTRSRPSQLELARRYAGELADYLEATYEEVDARAYSADLGDSVVIHWFVDCRTLDAWASARREMLRDDTYIELLERGHGLLLEEGAKEAMLLDVEMDPASVDPYTLGQILADWGDREGAIRSFREAVEREPRNVDALISLGQNLRGLDFRTADAEGARAVLERALELDPGNIWALDELGLALWYLDDLEGAIAVFEQVLESWPDHHSALYNLGRLYYETGRYELALQTFRRHQASGPSTLFVANGLQSIGRCLQELGDPQGAIASFRQAVAVRPEKPSLSLTLGGALCDAGEYAEAARVLERALELYDEPNPQSAFYLAIAHAGLGHADEAQRWYDRAVEWMGSQDEPTEELRGLRVAAEDALDG